MPSAGSKPIQEQLVAARRRQILDAATRVIAAKGFHRATIREIARQAGIAEGTIYNYFANKTDLLFGLLDRFNESGQRPEALAQLAAGDLRSTFEELVRQRLEAVRPQLPTLKALLPELLFHEPLRRRWLSEILAPTVTLAREAFDQLAEAGVLRPMDSELVVRLVAGTVFGILMLELLGDPVTTERRDDLPREIVTLLFDGLLPEGERS